MLTFNNAFKPKEAETDKIDRIDTGNQVSNSEIWDAFNSQSVEDEFFNYEEPELNWPQAQTEQTTSKTLTTTSDSSGSFKLSSARNLVQRRPKIVHKHNIKIRHDGE
ncbi:unnamed protein product [Oikopleura dioica]|uniref:Uncharacterized protein n=1 Tax=Oikopleura dioica TaxID=34765 RepID=E4Z6V0_OIKDI|nr:unnamed protein product [Oikopleura dioica]